MSGTLRVYHGEWFEGIPDGRGEEFLISNTNELIEYFRGEFVNG